MKHRKFLDKAYDPIKETAGRWKLKRSSIKRDVLKAVPDITKNECENIAWQYGLDAESDPRNKHYVRCMHD